MSSTLTHSTTSTTAVPAQRQPTDRARSRRTTWVVAGAVAAVISATGGAVAVRSSDDPPARAATSWSPGADAAESSHGFGPGVPAADQAVRQGPEAVQLVHGTRGALRDAAGRPLAP
jgi:hypothetical protein